MNVLGRFPGIHWVSSASGPRRNIPTRDLLDHRLWSSGHERIHHFGRDLSSACSIACGVGSRTRPCSPCCGPDGVRLRPRPLAWSGVESGEPDATSGVRRGAPGARSGVRSAVTEQDGPLQTALEPAFRLTGQREPKRQICSIAPEETSGAGRAFVSVNSFSANSYRRS